MVAVGQVTAAADVTRLADLAAMVSGAAGLVIMPAVKNALAGVVGHGLAGMGPELGEGIRGGLRVVFNVPAEVSAFLIKLNWQPVNFIVGTGIRACPDRPS